MDSTLEQRMERMEARLRALEESLAALTSAVGLPRVAAPPAAPRPVPPPVPPPAPPPAPPPLPVAASAPAPWSRARPLPGVADAVPPVAGASAPRPAFDLERFLGMAVLGRVGIAAVVLAAAYFGQLGWGRLTPAARVAMIYLGASVLVAAGWFLRPRAAVKYVAYLWGGATALAYLAGVLARMLYQMVDAPAALAMLVGATALGQLLARVIRVEPLATVAIAGAYAAPVLVGEDSATPTALFVYLLALHSWAAWTEFRWSWPWARRLAAFATVGMAYAWVSNHHVPADLSTVLHMQAILGGVAAPEILRAVAGRAVAPLRWVLFLTGATVLELFTLAWTAANETLPAFGVFAGGLGLGLAAVLRPRSADSGVPPTGLARLAGVLVAFGALLVWSTRTPGPSWPPDVPWLRLWSLVAAGVLLLALRPWVLAGDLGAAVAAALAILVALSRPPVDAGARAQAALALTIPALLVARGGLPLAPAVGLLLGSLLTFFGVCSRFTFGNQDPYWLPIAFGTTGGWAVLGTVVAGLRRDRVLVGAAAAVLLVLGILWAVVTFQDQPAEPTEGLPAFVNLRFLTGLMLLGLLELARRTVPAEARPWGSAILAVETLGLSWLVGLAEVLALARAWPDEWSAVAVSVYSMLFAAGLLIAGFVRRNPWLRWPGLAGFGAVVLKVAIHDLASVSTPLRVLVTGALGLALLLAAWGYARRRDGGRDGAEL